MSIIRRRPTSFIVFCFMLFLASSTIACAGPVDKAKEFMKARMYPQAIAVLESEITKNPTSAEAHFQLAVCYIQTGNIYGADQRFASAVAIKPDLYGTKVGDEYLNIGTSLLTSGQFDLADDRYSKALQYQPTLKDVVADRYSNAGTLYLERNQVNEAKRLFGKALGYRPEKRSLVADTFFKKGSELLQWDINKSEELFSAAIGYDSSVKERICTVFFKRWNNPKSYSDLVELSKTRSYCSTYDKDILKSYSDIIPGFPQIGSLDISQTDKDDIYQRVLKYLPEKIVAATVTPEKSYIISGFKSGNHFVYLVAR